MGRSLHFGWIFAAFLLGGCAATAPVETASIDPFDAKSSLEGKMTPDGTIVVCRSITLTGTRFPAKSCKSEKAWKTFDAQIKEQAQKSVERVQRNQCSGEPGRC